MVRLRNERGTAAVEFAIVAPLLFALVFGIISFGILYNRQASLTAAAREGARFGATLPTGTTGVTDGWLDNVASSAIDAATGELGAVFADRTVCVAYVGYGSPAGSTVDSTRRRMQAGADPAVYAAGSASDPSTWCFDDGKVSKPAERRVQVLVRRDAELQVILFSRTIPVTGQGLARFEAVSP